MQPTSCPFCGSDFVRAHPTVASLLRPLDQQLWGVTCGNCAAGGPPSGSSEEHAILLWNRAAVRCEECYREVVAEVKRLGDVIYIINEQLKMVPRITPGYATQPGDPYHGVSLKEGQ